MIPAPRSVLPPAGWGLPAGVTTGAAGSTRTAVVAAGDSLSVPRLPGGLLGPSAIAGSAGSAGAVAALCLLLLLVTPGLVRWLRMCTELDWSPVFLPLLERPG